MDLRTYLFTHRLKGTAFSQQIGCSIAHLYGLIHKKRKPSKWLAQSIEIATDGEVTIEELMKEGDNGT